MPARSPALPAAAATKLTSLGERLRDRRKALAVSLVDAAEAAGMARVTLQRIERGEPSVTMGAWLGAAVALGLELELVDPRAKRSAVGKPPYPARIRLADFPQLKSAAWQLHGVATLSPEEALGLYERNWHHLDTAALEPAERALVEALVKHLGGGRLLV